MSDRNDALEVAECLPVEVTEKVVRIINDDDNQNHDDEDIDFFGASISGSYSESDIESSEDGSTLSESEDPAKVLLQQHEEYMKTGQQNMTQDADFKVSVKLLHILKKHKADLKLFDELFEWANEAVIDYKFDFKSKPKKREKIVKDLIEQFDLKEFMPKAIKFQLYSTKTFKPLIVHSPLQAIYGLLNDPTSTEMTSTYSKSLILLSLFPRKIQKLYLISMKDFHLDCTQSVC